MSDEWYTAEELAKFLNTSKTEIYRLGRAKKLERSRIKGKLYFRYDRQLQIDHPATIAWRARFLAAADRIVEKYHNHPWLISIAAISSILGLVLAVLVLIPARAPEPPPVPASAKNAEANNQIFQDTPNVRATYLRMEGTILLDRVLNGFGFSAEDGFALKPIWLKNEIYQRLESLLAICKQRSTQTQEFDLATWYAGNGGNELWYANYDKFADSATESAPKSNKRVTAPKGFYKGGIPLRGPNRVGPVDIIDMMQRVESSPYWYVSTKSKAEILPFDEFSIFGLLHTEEILRYTKDPLSREIAQTNPNIQDVAFLYVYCSHGDYHGLVLIRELKMLVLDIENVGDKPIGLSTIRQRIARADSPYRLRSSAVIDTALAQVNREDSELPLELLRPNEHLFIPLSLQFAFATVPNKREMFNSELYVDKSDLPAVWWMDRVNEQIPFQILRGADRSGNPITTVVVLNKSALENKPKVDASVESSYYLGSVIDVQEVVFKTGAGDLTPWKVRRFQPHNLIARGAFEGGSCPVLFYRDPTRRQLRRVGPILIDAVTRHRQRTVRIVAERDVDTFVIAEMEPETSFIDQVYLEATDENGFISILRPETNRLIRDLDNRFVQLTRGSRLEINFKVPNQFKKANIRNLVISGFYIPDSMIRD